MAWGSHCRVPWSLEANSGVKVRVCASQKALEGNDRHTDTHTHDSSIIIQGSHASWKVLDVFL